MPEKILIVDDDLDTLKLVGMMLQRRGYSIVAAINGTQALSKAASDRPDLILLDVMMPFVDGVEVLRRLKESDELKHIPVIMLTARTSDNDFSIGFDIGAADYVEKPFSIVKLVTRIHKVLRDAGLESPPAGPVSS